TRATTARPSSFSWPRSGAGTAPSRHRATRSTRPTPSIPISSPPHRHAEAAPGHSGGAVSYFYGWGRPRFFGEKLFPGYSVSPSAGIMGADDRPGPAGAGGEPGE